MSGAAACGMPDIGSGFQEINKAVRAFAGYFMEIRATANALVLSRISLQDLNYVSPRVIVGTCFSIIFGKVRWHDQGYAGVHGPLAAVLLGSHAVSQDF